MNLWKCYLRWRHSKGFGVHSPFAFRFVTDVLKPGRYGYYAYGHLPADLRDNSFCKFIIRLGIFLKTGRILGTDKMEKPLKACAAALKIHYRGIKRDETLKFNSSDLLVTENDAVSPGIISEALNNGASVLAINPGKVAASLLCSQRENGLLFKGRKKLLVIPTGHMAFVAYDIIM